MSAPSAVLGEEVLIDLSLLKSAILIIIMLSAYIQSSIAESSASDANNEDEKVCDNTEKLHQLFTHPKQELLHRQNVIEEMTQSCNISSVNLYAGAKEVNTIAHTVQHTHLPYTHHMSLHTHPHTHPYIKLPINK